MDEGVCRWLACALSLFEEWIFWSGSHELTDEAIEDADDEDDEEEEEEEEEEDDEEEEEDEDGDELMGLTLSKKLRSLRSGKST